MSSDLIKRINGQIWIDKEPPYRLKYHLDGTDYVVEVAAVYKPGEPSEPGQHNIIPTGTIVKLIQDDIVAPAVFPDDINGVIGITINDADSSDPDFSQTAISQSGYVIFSDYASIRRAFPFEEDLNVKTNLWNDEIPLGNPTKNGIGCPVYWFIGRTNFSGNVGSRTYTYEDSTAHPGKITLQTPSGLKWLQTENSPNFDESMNVAYDNLPIIGAVARYEYYTPDEISTLTSQGANRVTYIDETGSEVTKELKVWDLKYLAIHLNFSKFDSSVEWNWPYLHSKTCGKIDCNLATTPNADFIKYNDGLSTTVTFRHGLFANNKYYSQLASYVDIVASQNPDELRDGPDYIIHAAAKHIIGKPKTTPVTDETEYEPADRKTEVTLSTPETLNYRIVGEVRYKFDKGHDE